MAFLLTLKQLWPTIKADFIRLFYFIKNNDVSKLLLLSGLIGKCQSNSIFSNNFNNLSILSIIETSIFSLLFLMMLTYFFSFLYYRSFNIKKTDYKISRILYFFCISIVIMDIFLRTTSINNPVAFLAFKSLYILVLLTIIINLRKILVQQYNNVHDSIFKKISTHTGLVVIVLTPNHFYSRKRLHLNHYMIGFNTNIKTWMTLGIFLIMDKEGVYLKKIFITYNEIVMFNETFDKKITHYSKNELDTAIMYSI